jgi:uncharacterized protein
VSDTGINDYFATDEDGHPSEEGLPLGSTGTPRLIPPPPMPPAPAEQAAPLEPPAASWIPEPAETDPAGGAPLGAFPGSQSNAQDAPAEAPGIRQPDHPARAIPTVSAPTTLPGPLLEPEPAPATPPRPVPSVEAEPPAGGHGALEAALHAELGGLISGSPDIEAAAVVSLDGFAMASALPEGMEEDRVGAMSAAILALGERAARELGKGTLTQVFIQGEDGYVMLMAAGQTAVLTCLASADSKLGLVIYDMRRATKAIGEIVG